jgi:alpha-L-fucosidase
MCQTLNQHWGHVDDDIHYKSINELISNLVDCRANNCNMLLNVGPTADGSIEPIERCIFQMMGKWIKVNKNFIYDVSACEDIKAENCLLVKDENYYYAMIKDVPMQADPNVQRLEKMGQVWIEKEIVSAEWLDDGSKITFDKNEFKVDAYELSRCYCARVAKLTLKD